MNDEQMQPLLDSWFREREVAPRDVRAGVAKVMTDLPRTRQQGRWWPLPAFHRKAQTSTATAIDTTDFRPSPVPATNGHAPTAIGRTRTMFSPVKTITAGALVFVIGGAFLIAQPLGQPASAPGAVTDPTSEVPVAPAAAQGEEPTLNPDMLATAIVSGTESCEITEFGSLVETDVWANVRRDFVIECVAEMSDPRVTGTSTSSLNTDCSPFGCVMWGTFELIGPDGSWVGDYTQTLGHGDDGHALRMAIGEGTGAYEGWTYISHTTYVGMEGTVEGFVFPGDPPPMR